MLKKLVLKNEFSITLAVFSGSIESWFCKMVFKTAVVEKTILAYPKQTKLE